METLLEVHSGDELNYINDFIDIVGVNNRNLKVFKTDVQTSFDLAPLLSQPSTTPTQATGPVFVSESGIGDPETVRKLRAAGFRGFLMGGHFMKNPDPGAALADFIRAI